MSDIATDPAFHNVVDYATSPITMRSGGFGFIQTAQAQPGDTDSSGSALPHRLAKVYEHIHNTVSYQQRLFQDWTITTGNQVPFGDDDVQPLRGEPIVVPMETGLSYATLTVNWTAPADFDVRLLPPAGQPSGTIESSRSPTNQVFRIKDPKAGDWTVALNGPKGQEIMVLLSGTSLARGFLRPVLDVPRTPLGMKTGEVPEPLQPGDSVPLALLLFGDGPIKGAQVRASVRSRLSDDQNIDLTDDGKGPDEKSNDGIYTGVITNTQQGGAFDIEAVASWTGAGGVARHRYFSTALSVRELDSDGDGISDDNEFRSGLDPTNPKDAEEDQDRDGLDSWKELYIGTNPLKRDTDEGGVDDGTEVYNGSNALDPSDDARSPQDSDGDGMTDLWETTFGLDSNNADDAEEDADRDGLSNKAEFDAHTSPTQRDSDRDGVDDNTEVELGSDPTDGRPIDEEPTQPGSVPSKGSSSLLCWVLVILLLLVLLIVLSWNQRLRVAAKGTA